MYIDFKLESKCKKLLWTEYTDTLSACPVSTLETIVADFGDNFSPNSATVAEKGDCRIWRQLPFSVTVSSVWLKLFDLLWKFLNITDVCVCLLKIQFQNTRFCHEIFR